MWVHSGSWRSPLYTKKTLILKAMFLSRLYILAPSCAVLILFHAFLERVEAIGIKITQGQTIKTYTRSHPWLVRAIINNLFMMYPLCTIYIYFFFFAYQCVYHSGADPESGNCGSSHFKRPFIRDETELEMNTL